MSLLNRIPESRLTRLVVKRQGRWSFVTIPSIAPVYRGTNFRIHQTKYEFGLVAANQTSATQIKKYGSKSDLLVVHSDGTLGIISREAYKRRYEKTPTVPETNPVSSSSKQAKNKIEEQSKKYIDPRSNTIPVERATKLSRPAYNPKDERGSRY